MRVRCCSLQEAREGVAGCQYIEQHTYTDRVDQNSVRAAKAAEARYSDAQCSESAYVESLGEELGQFDCKRPLLRRIQTCVRLYNDKRHFDALL
jgi:hypothetical protein